MILAVKGTLNYLFSFSIFGGALIYYLRVFAMFIVLLLVTAPELCEWLLIVLGLRLFRLDRLF